MDPRQKKGSEVGKETSATKTTNVVWGGYHKKAEIQAQWFFPKGPDGGASCVRVICLPKFFNFNTNISAQNPHCLFSTDFLKITFTVFFLQHLTTRLIRKEADSTLSKG